MIKKIIILVLFIVTSIIATAQYRSKIVDKFIIKLKHRNIDTILIYKEGSTWHIIKADCNCSVNETISTVYLLYQKNGNFFGVNLSCCNESDTLKLDKISSISYLLSLADMLKKVDEYYKNSISNKKFPPPIPTDNPFQDVELITPNKHLRFSLNSYQKGKGYSIWKEYFWIDKEINVIKLIMQDLKLDKS